MTTPVGSIRLDLLIDGSGSKEQVERAVRQATAGLGDEFQHVQREHDKTARTAEKSGAKQTAAAKATTKAVGELGDEHTKNAAKTEASAAAQARSIKAVTRALDEQARAWEKLAVAKAAATAAPEPRAPSGGSGGGGGGGYRGGGGGGGVRWHGGRGNGLGGFFGSPVGVNAGALAIGSFPAAATAVVNLTGAIQQLGQAGLMLPGIFAGIGSSVGTAVIGFKGMSDAVSALTEAAKSGDWKDLEKANQAIADLAPSAQATAKAVAAVVPRFQELQKAFVAQPMFEGLDETITTLTDRSMPTLQKGLGGIATAWNKTFKQIGSTLGSDSSLSLMDRIFGNTAEAQTRMNKAIEPLVHGFGTLTAKATEFLPRIADGFGAVMTRFDNWITKSSENGNLDKWINQGIDAAKHLGESFLNVGKIITALTKAAGGPDGDGGFLKWLDDASGKLATFLNSDAGQAKLTKFFEDGKQQLKEWGDILKNALNIIGDVYNGMKKWADVLLPIISSITGALAAMPGGIEGVATAFLTWKTLSGVTSLLGLLDGVGSRLDGLPGKARKAGDAVNDAAGGRGGRGGWAGRLGNAVPGLAIGLPGIVDSWENPGQDNRLNTLASVGGFALSGAELAGPIGALTGALVGGIASIVPVLIDESKKQAAQQAADQKFWEDNADGGRRGWWGHKRQAPLNLDDLPNVITGNGPAPGIIDTPPPSVSDLLLGTKPQSASDKVLGNVTGQISALPTAVTIPVETPGADKSASDVGGLLQNLVGLPPQKSVEVSVPGADTALSKLQGIASALANIKSKSITVGISQTGSGSSTGSSWFSPQPKAAGGPIFGGIPGLDSVPILGMPGEHMLTTAEVAAGGGHSGIYRLRAMLRAGWFKGMEDGGAVDGTPPPSGLSPLAADIAAGLRNVIQPMLGLLAQIRDNIGGRAGATGYMPSTTDTVLASAVTPVTPIRRTGGNAAAGDYKSYPLGDPRRIMAGVMSGMGMPADEIAVALGGNMLSAASGPVSDLVGDVATNVLTTPLPGPLGYPGAPTAPSTDLNRLVEERNPLAIAQGAGFDVPDYSRFGGGPQDVMRNSGPASDAMGRMHSDTAALVDRTFTNLDAAEKARHDQVMTVLNEVKDRLGKDGLVPVLKEGVADGMDGMGDGVTAAIGTSLGQAAAGPIASAVQSAMPTPSSSGSASSPQFVAAQTPVHAGTGAAPGPAMFIEPIRAGGFHELPTGFGPLGGLYDIGGLWPSGTFGTNLSGEPERVLDPQQTRLFDAGLLGGWNLQPQQQHFATQAGVDVTDQVGGDFFGVSQVPVLGALVNLLVTVLLRVIGVQIEARDTLNEISGEFRQFRGEFQAFDAAGRMMNDTSALTDRTGSSEQTAADERVRILKLVLEGLIKFIIEKIIVPVGKAVANAAIQAGATAANGAITGGLTAALPTGGSVIGGMVGSVVSGAITAGGSAAVDIIAEVGTQLGEAALGVLIQGTGEILQSVFPDITKFFFGGGFMAAIADPVTKVLTNVLGGLTSVFGAVVGGMADLWPFDNGGLANGMGLMPKAVIAPERVLSPRETRAFEAALDRGFIGSDRGTSMTTVHAPITVMGGPAAAPAIRDYLVSRL